MNILLICPNSPYESIGGIERYILNLINYYKEKTDSKLFLVLPQKDKSYFKQIGNVNIFFEESFFISRNWKSIQKKTTEKARIFSELLEEIIKKNKIDIICAENFLFGLPPSYVLLLNMIAIKSNIPLVLRLHSFLVTDLQAQLTNQLMWNQISCVSKSVTGDCFHKGADINSLSTHYLGVDTKEFNEIKKDSESLREKIGLRPEHKIILTATRIIHGNKNILQEKGITNLIQAFSKLSPRFPNLKLLIAVGRAPENLKTEFDASLQMLKGYIKLNNVQDSTVVKMFSLEDMPSVYRGCDIFTLPSENETFGQVYIEAMACGVPVIGTKVGGIPEIISDSYNGYLIQPGDSSMLAQKIETLIVDEGIRKKFIYSGFSTVKKYYTSEKQFSSFHSMLNTLIQ